METVGARNAYFSDALIGAAANARGGFDPNDLLRYGEGGRRGGGGWLGTGGEVVPTGGGGTVVHCSAVAASRGSYLAEPPTYEVTAIAVESIEDNHDNGRRGKHPLNDYR